MLYFVLAGALIVSIIMIAYLYRKLKFETEEGLLCLENFENQLRTKQHRIAVLNKKYKDLKLEIAALGYKSNVDDESDRDLIKEIDTLNLYLADRNEKISDLRQELTALEKEMQRRSSQLNFMEETFQSFESLNRSLQIVNQKYLDYFEEVDYLESLYYRPRPDIDLQVQYDAYQGECGISRLDMEAEAKVASNRIGFVVAPAPSPSYSFSSSLDRDGNQIFFLFPYFSKSMFPNLCASDHDTRQLLWDFKNGVPSVSRFFAKQISSNLLLKFKSSLLPFDGNDLIAVIPASTKYKNQRRYEAFCKEVSEQTSLMNGYEVIQINYDRPAHKGQRVKSKIANLSFYPGYYEGRTVYLIDDIITTGESFTQTAKLLKKTGAKEVIGIFLGKTHYEYPYIDAMDF